MTNKQIADAYMAQIVLGGIVPSHEIMKDISEKPKLSEERCADVAARVAAECTKLRAKYVERLNRAGYDTV